ncbi:MAG: hypothetical protein Q7T64_07040 [Lacisediminimonas sp.]|nr:hypothetical protein [Lacisediminimonas sp.]
MAGSSLSGQSGIAGVQGSQEIPGLARNWCFSASKIAFWRRVFVVEGIFWYGLPAPEWTTIKRVNARDSWVLYFLYAPDGKLMPYHAYALSRLRDLGANVLVICAARTASLVPPELARYADALYWKALHGYDFSAYRIGLMEIARRSAGADVLLMNDSVFGPFTDPIRALSACDWDLAGFTASSEIENHIQSYAFRIRNVAPARMRALRAVLFPVACLDRKDDVILIQETRMARIASASMSVGSLWYGASMQAQNPTLYRPAELVNAGFPFLKRSLSRMNPANKLMTHALLERHHHPLPD